VEVEDESLTILLYISKSHSINEIISQGVAPVPSRTVRPGDILETRPNKFNTTKRWKNKRKNKLTGMENQ